MKKELAKRLGYPDSSIGLIFSMLVPHALLGILFWFVYINGNSKIIGYLAIIAVASAIPMMFVYEFIWEHSLQDWGIRYLTSISDSLSESEKKELGL